MANAAPVNREATTATGTKRAALKIVRRYATLLLMLLLLAGIPFLPAVFGDFVWVDHTEIEQRGYLVLSQQDFHDVWRMTLEEYMSRQGADTVSSGGYYRPLYALAMTASYHAYGLDPLKFHLENLIWHAMVVWGLFLMGRRWGATPATSFVAAACFAVHPVTVTSVSWISGRKDLMCAAFGVWAIVCVMHALTSRRAIGQWFAALLALLLATGSVLSKELGVVVPVIALLAAGQLYLNRSDLRLASESRTRPHLPVVHPLTALLMLVIVALPAVAMMWFRKQQLGGLGLNAHYPHESWWANVVTSCELGWVYVGRVFWPRDPRISDAWIVDLPSIAMQVVVVVGAAIVLIWALVGYIRRTKIAAPVLWWLLWMLPAMGILPLRQAAVCFLVRDFLYQFPRQLVPWNSPSLSASERGKQEKAREGTMYLFGSVLIIAMGVQTAIANRYWMNDQALFTHAVEQDPNYLEGRVALSSQALFADDLSQAIEQGEEVLARATSQPGLVAYWSPYIARTNLGLAYLRSGRTQAAVEQFQTIKQQWPDDSPTDFHLGQAYLANGQPQLAQRAFERRLRQVPDDFGAMSNLALAFLFQQEFAEAISRLEPLVAARPDDVTNRINLANAYLANQQFEPAYVLLAQLFAERREDPIVIAKLAFVLMELGQVRRAEQVIVHGLRVAPNHPLIQSNAERIRAVVEQSQDAAGAEH